MEYFLVGTLVLSTVYQCVELKIRHSTYPQEISRSTIYNPTVTRKTCLLKPDSGPCRANIQMYYFIPSNITCGTFNWGGCQGNGNRFDTIEQCKDTCLTKPEEKSRRPRYCELSFDYGYCFGAVTRYYYDRLWKVCKETIYSGCGGNKNHFYSLEQCEAVCRFGTGKLRTFTKEQRGIRKVVVVNPLNTTPARGRNQTMTSSAAPAAPLTDST